MRRAYTLGDALDIVAKSDEILSNEVDPDGHVEVIKLYRHPENLALVASRASQNGLPSVIIGDRQGLRERFFRLLDDGQRFEVRVPGQRFVIVWDFRTLNVE